MQSPVAVLLLIFCLGLSHASVHKRAEIRSRRMVGGVLAKRVPWQALLYYGESVLQGGLGGGALVSDRWILTSGRNLFLNDTQGPAKGKPTGTFKVYVGLTDRNLVEPSNEVEVEKMVVHPCFQKSSNWDHNLALIKLKEPVTFSESVMPIPLPEAGQHLEEKVGTWGILAGWGWGIHFTFADRLKYMVVPVVSQELCQAEYVQTNLTVHNTPRVDNRTFCGGASAYDENACFGDEGGALAVLDPANNKVYAAGILSYDKSCRAKKYTVYTKLSAYMPWINSVMRGDSEKYSALRATVMSELTSK
ncbi:hypothetical protein SKAU_G00345490 [Synaphobranchus kaupii]|uniref:Peptidase S1 domain-containing protein n=1 Tax=Synaphobranchus kaupii TaxID=118154 RepID=A0A9Q1IHN0_SYNKA|nr:hypothetical protein SKAU_G00345490 [Synaphobranchus kaupii]